MDFHRCVDGQYRNGEREKCDFCNHKREHAKVNWSPFATNVLDAEEFDLCKPDGTPVDFHRSNGGFVLVIDGKRWETGDNIQMSYWMNQHDIGGVRKP